ncbi:MAG: ABC transporter ATP-binding protein [Nitriliruptoraceae bacterium]
MMLFEVEQLVVTFTDTTALDGVSFAVGPGEIVGLVGANGAGKTTTIRAGLGLTRPTAGQVLLMGAPPSRRGRAQVGYVPQALGLWQDLTVAQNLALIAAAYGVRAPQLPAALAGVADQPVASLPLGYRRRVAFEAALSHDPRLLILDEPTSGVGSLERARLWDRIHTVGESGTGVLVTTHHMSEAEQCDRVIVLSDGRIGVAGTMQQLLEGQQVVVVSAADRGQALARLEARFVGVSLAGGQVRVPDADPAEVSEVLAGLDAQVSTAPASFDEVFVALARRA